MISTFSIYFIILLTFDYWSPILKCILVKMWHLVLIFIIVIKVLFVWFA